ncbi:MAG: hypothetical protein D6776_05055, partial [Planctomycetota bacterium]
MARPSDPTSSSTPAPAAVPDDAPAATRIDDYEILERVGEGGFGHVLRARAPDGRVVAIKRLHDATAAADELAYEFRLLTRLRHPHIVAVLDFGFTDGVPYLVTDWIEGADIVTACRGWPLRELAPTLAGMLRALEHMHARGVLHRDLKPHNVLVDAHGKAWLIDFGLAGLAGRGGSRSGTPAYAPPERLLGRPEDPRSDLYAVGVLLHVLLHGELPSRDGSHRSPASPIEALIARLLSPNPADRPRTANAVIEALGEITGLALETERGLPDRGPLSNATGLVGRRRELAWFRREVAAARHRIVLVEAAAGMGKSQLLRAFAAEATVGRAQVLTGRHLRELLPESAAAAADDVADQLLAEAAHRRLVVLLDDVHRLEPDEAERLLGWLTRIDMLRRPRPGRGLLVVLAYRPEELAARGLEAHVARARALGRTRRLRLGPLAPADMAPLVTELLGRHTLPPPFFAALHERTGGRPALALDVLRTLRTGGAIAWSEGAWRLAHDPVPWPPSPEQLLVQQLEELAPLEREVLLWLRCAGRASLSELRAWMKGGETGAPERATLERLVHEHRLLAVSRAPGRGAVYALANDRVAELLGDDPAAAVRHDVLAAERRHERRRWLEHAARG